MFQTIIGAVSSFMYSKLLVIILIGAGLYFTIRTRFPQVRLFERACESVMEKPDDKEAISSFQALMVSTASRVGTGNIVGVSSAICIGGFGSVFWMWVIAIIGSASALIESTLAQIYKKKGEDGKCYGGPAYYIEAALHCRPLAIVFCIAMILTYAFGFNMLASYNLQSTFSGFSFYDPKVSPWIIGGILAVLTGWCLLATSSSSASMTGAVAAIAEPPQMEDPTPTSVEIFPGTCITLCNRYAMIRDVEIVVTIIGSDCFPVSRITERFSPKPRRITAY